MEKIIFEDLPSTKTPLNAENLNQLQTNVENAIKEVDNRTIYSTTEQVVGTWTNGKPIYRKVINSTVSEIASKINSIGIDTLVDIKGKAKSVYNNTWNIPNYFSTEKYNIYCYEDTSGIVLEFGSFFESSSAVSVILEYTKTTETAL